MSIAFDILGMGCVAVDELLYVPSFPVPDTKMRVRHRERQCGGLAATALVAAARAGARCTYAGTLGDDGETAIGSRGNRWRAQRQVAVDLQNWRQLPAGKLARRRIDQPLPYLLHTCCLRRESRCRSVPAEAHEHVRIRAQRIGDVKLVDASA